MTTQIVFVGHHKERLLESIRALREFPVSKIILVLGEQRSKGEELAKKIAEELKKELTTIWDVEITAIDKKDILRATNQLVEIIKKEDGEVILNISGSLRTFSIAAYVTACITNSRIISSIPKLDENDQEIGIEEIVEIPNLPVSLPGKEQLEIIKAIDGEVDSMDEIVYRLNKNIKKESQQFRSERSRISHHLTKLEEDNFVTRKKMGRNVAIKVTPLGMAVSKIAGLEDRRE